MESFPPAVHDRPVLDAVGRRGLLRYEFNQEGDRTVLTRASCTSPWHYFPPNYLDDSGCAFTWLVNPSGGLVGGDHVSVEAELNPSTHVVMTSPSANRVYRSLSEPAVQEVRLTIGHDARLEWMPDVTIPFGGSRFAQSIQVDLAAGARIVLWDALASGRVAREERWAFTSLENEICVRTASRGSVVERFRVTPDLVGSFMRGWDYVASLFLVGDAVEAAQWTLLRDALADVLDTMKDEVLGGVTEPSVPGLVVKLVARSAPGLTQVQEVLWDRVRRELFGLPVPALRRY